MMALLRIEVVQAGCQLPFERMAAFMLQIVEAGDYLPKPPVSRTPISNLRTLCVCAMTKMTSRSSTWAWRRTSTTAPRIPSHPAPGCALASPFT